MLEILDETTGDLLAVRVSGKQAHEDVHELAALLDARIAKSGAARCLLELADIEGVELRALKEGLVFDIEHAHTIDRCAVVGDRDWERWLTKLYGLFFRHAELRFFEPSQREEALAWLREAP